MYSYVVEVINDFGHHAPPRMSVRILEYMIYFASFASFYLYLAARAPSVCASNVLLTVICLSNMSPDCMPSGWSHESEVYVYVFCF
jgi:hypothetical protein